MRELGGHISLEHHAIFKAGAKALEAVGLGREEYKCPICCVDFTINAISKKSPEDYRLTLEHAPPDFIGGSVVALTCKKCNNNLGSRLDSQIAARELLFQRLDPSRPEPRPIRATLKLRDSPQSDVNIRFSGKISDGIKTTLSKEHNHPDKFGRVLQALQNASEKNHTFAARLTFPSYDERLSDLAFLKSAFLCLFAKFGYTYALSEPAQFLVSTFLEKTHLDIVKLVPFENCGNNILVSEEMGLCFVGFGDFQLVCPWLNASVEKFVSACEQRDIFLRHYTNLSAFEMPTKLEAILDK